MYLQNKISEQMIAFSHSRDWCPLEPVWGYTGVNFSNHICR